MRLRMQMPSVDPNVYDRPPERCPLCGGPTWHSHGWPDKAIRDTRLEGVKPQRIQCTSCDHTMRLYPQGITKRKQSERLRGLTILLYLLGSSYRGVADVVSALGTFLSHTTVYNNVQDAGQAVRQLKQKRLAGSQVRVLGADGTHVKIKGQDTVLVHLGDGEKGICLAIEVGPGEDTASMQELVAAVAAAVGAEVLLSDDLDSYKEVADAVGLKHQLCQQHVVPNTLRKVAQITAQLLKRREKGGETESERDQIASALEHLAELEQIILWRSPGRQKRLDELAQVYEREAAPQKGQRATPFYRLKLLPLRLAGSWSRLTLTEVRRDEDGCRFIPRTNNGSEQSIGLNIKERYRTMRGYKSVPSALRVTTLTAFLREAEDDQALIQALAA